MHDLIARAKAENIRFNVIEAFDQPWKRLLEGTVGGHWGFITNPPRQFKFAWGAPVSNHPHWPWQAAGGVLFAALIFAAAVLSQQQHGRPEMDGRGWASVALIAAAGGTTLGWTIENATLESLGWEGWLRSFMLVGLSLGVPLAAAAAIGAQVRAPNFADLLGRRTLKPPRGALARLPMALGTLLILTTVMATQAALGFTFNARYLDFPFAPLTAAVVPFLLVSLIGMPSAAVTTPARAETAAAAILVPCAIYVAWHEGFNNWQSLWFCATLLGLAFTLARARGARG
jgi:glucan 1,3-beta-glucosidase